eukprot:COSAG01_NODE_1274_length_10946_cov_46.531483_1_plen_220_part_10
MAPTTEQSDAPRRWCKKCKLVFSGAKCPADHAPFCYTKKLPAEAETAPEPEPGPEPELETQVETKLEGVPTAGVPANGDGLQPAVHDDPEPSAPARAPAPASAATPSGGVRVPGGQLAVFAARITEAKGADRAAKEQLRSGGDVGVATAAAAQLRTEAVSLYRAAVAALDVALGPGGEMSNKSARVREELEGRRTKVTKRVAKLEEAMATEQLVPEPKLE